MFQLITFIRSLFSQLPFCFSSFYRSSLFVFMMVSGAINYPSKKYALFDVLAVDDPQNIPRALKKLESNFLFD